jgi:hypothetical protein
VLRLIHFPDLQGKLLLKSESQRISWRGFFEHSYLQPKSLAASTFSYEAKMKRSVQKQLVRSRAIGGGGEKAGPILSPNPFPIPNHLQQQPVNTNVATTTNPTGNVPLGPPPKYTAPTTTPDPIYVHPTQPQLALEPQAMGQQQQQPLQQHLQQHASVLPQERKPDRYPADFSWMMKVLYLGVGTYVLVVKQKQSVHSLKQVLGMQLVSSF